MQNALRAFPRTRALFAGLIQLAALALLIFASRSVIADWNHVPTGSMKPTIVEGDVIFVNKLAYDLKIPFTTVRLANWAEPRRGDIVVLFSPANGDRLVKRVIGLPGDHVAMYNERLVINGEAVEYSAGDYRANDNAMSVVVLEERLDSVQHPIMLRPAQPAPRSFDPVRVPPGEYLVLGDNRDNSSDSRYFGFVPRELIVGRAIGVVLSLDPEDNYLPRGERFAIGIN